MIVLPLVIRHVLFWVIISVHRRLHRGLIRLKQSFKTFFRLYTTNAYPWTTADRNNDCISRYVLRTR